MPHTCIKLTGGSSAFSACVPLWKYQAWSVWGPITQPIGIENSQAAPLGLRFGVWTLCPSPLNEIPSHKCSGSLWGCSFQCLGCLFFLFFDQYLLILSFVWPSCACFYVRVCVNNPVLSRTCRHLVLNFILNPQFSLLFHWQITHFFLLFFFFLN